MHRKKSVLNNNNSIVERNPSSGNPALTGFLFVCLVAAYLWSNYDGDVLKSEEENLVARQAPQDASSSLHEAIKRGLLEDIQSIVKDIDKAALNTVFSGMTPVMTASSAGDVRIVEFLLKHGADPDKRGSAKRTALQYAAEKNRIAIARKLLDFGADINAYDNTRLTPLIMAADRGYTDLGILLIESGADVNIQHVQGWTALIDAASNGNIMLVKRLLEAGADREISTGKGKRAIDFARQNKHQDIVLLLAE